MSKTTHLNPNVYAVHNEDLSGDVDIRDSGYGYYGITVPGAALVKLVREHDPDTAEAIALLEGIEEGGREADRGELVPAEEVLAKLERKAVPEASRKKTDNPYKRTAESAAWEEGYEACRLDQETHFWNRRAAEAERANMSVRFVPHDQKNAPHPIAAQVMSMHRQFMDSVEGMLAETAAELKLTPEELAKRFELVMKTEAEETTIVFTAELRERST